MNWVFFYSLYILNLGFFLSVCKVVSTPCVGKQPPEGHRSQRHLSFLQDHPFVLDLEVFVGKLPYCTRNPT